jgi:hypothetical protein
MASLVVPRFGPGAAVLALALVGVGQVACTAVNPAYVGPSADASARPKDASNKADKSTTGADAVDAAVPDDPPPLDAGEPGPSEPSPDGALVDMAPPDVAPPDLIPQDAPLDLAPPDLASPDVAQMTPRVTLGAASFTQVQGQPADNPVRDDRCPSGQVLTGFRGTVGLYMGMGTPLLTSLTGQCGSLKVDATAGEPFPVTVSSEGALPTRGMAQGKAFTALCPSNQMVVGFEGRAGSFIDQFVVVCAPLTVAGAPSLSVARGTSTKLPAVGGTGGEVFQTSCPAGRIAIGHRGEAVTVVDTLALACSAPSAAY